jgi:hypothetical protein
MGLLDALFGRKAGSRLPAYKEDAANPARRLVHGFLAFYTGDDGDPRHTLDQQGNLDYLRQAWDVGDAAELNAVMDRYESQQECNEAFDLIRVIRLARHGAGAGLLTDEESWPRAIRCAQRLKRRYATWEDVYADFQAGREQWWRQCARKQPPPEEYKEYAQLYSLGRALIFSKMPLN